jgi:hypothetical protein
LLPILAEFAALTKLTEAIAPEFTNGFTDTGFKICVARMELKGNPVGSTPIFSAITLALPCSCITSAAVKGLETDWI